MAILSVEGGELFLPEAQAIGESRPHNRRQDPWTITIALPWLHFFRVVVFYLKRIFLTDVQNGVVVTDDTGSAIAVPFLTENVPFDAAHYTADSGAWVLVAADVVNYSRLPLGHIRWVDVNVAGTSVTATPLILSVALPGGAVARYFQSAVVEIDDNGTLTSGLAYVDPAGTTINFVRQDRGTFATSVNATAIRGQIMVEIV